jgi:small subunit ribosomal protein S6
MTHYENVFIARQDISSAQVDALADAFSEIITAAGGKIHRREYWGLKSLQYRIKKNRKGHYVLLNIEAASDAMQEMERQMRLNEDVLRHMTIRTDELIDAPSVMTQGRGDRERPGRDSDNRPPRESQAPKIDAAPVETPAETPAEKGAEE